MTKELLSSAGVPFTEINVLADLSAFRHVCALRMLPPVVEVGGESASGYNRPAVRKLVGLS